MHFLDVFFPVVISFSSSHSEAKTKANRTLHPRPEPFRVHGTEFYLTLLIELDIQKREESADELLKLEREEKEWGREPKENLQPVQSGS